jgi:hypothetical protein
MASGGNFEPALVVLIEARKAGQDFVTAWPRAVEACDPDDRTTLRETTAAWKAEYQGKRSYGGDLLGALAVLDNDAGQRGDRASA